MASEDVAAAVADAPDLPSVETAISEITDVPSAPMDLADPVAAPQLSTIADLYGGPDLDEPSGLEPVGEPETATSDPSSEPVAEAAAEPATTEPADFPDYLIREGAEKGFSESEMRGFGSQEAAQSVMTAFDRRMMQLGQQQPEQQQPQPQTPVQQTQVSQSDPAAAMAAYELKLDPELVDENVLAALEGMNKHYADQAAMTQQAMGSMVQQNKQQAFDSQVQEFDRFVSGLGEEYNDVFGKGPTMGMRSGTDNFNNRDLAFTSALNARQGYINAGMRPPPLNDMFQRGLRMEFGDKIETIARRGVTNRVEKKAATQSHPPTRRAGRPVQAGTDEAVYEAAAKVFRDKDIPDTPKSYD